MPQKFLLSAFSKDRPGIVADISQLIYENGCNLEESAMTNLASEFAILLSFSSQSVADGADLEAKLAAECRRLEREKGITAFIRPVQTAEPQPKGDIQTQTIRVEGQDQAGIVYKVSRFLADRQINIKTLNSEVTLSPESGTAIYRMKLVVEIPAKLPLSTVEDGLGQIGEQLNVDVTLS